MMTLRAAITLSSTILLASCAAGRYAAPAPDAVKHEELVAAPFERAWSAAVDRLSASFYGINQIDKASGLISLQFTSSDHTLVDCGVVDVAAGQLPGVRPYSEFLFLNHAAQLAGRINVFIKPAGPDKAVARATVRFVLNTPRADPTLIPSTWVFDTGTSATLQVGTLIGGGRARTCRSSGKLEADILSAIRAAASQ